ncbi:MAG: 50S ribosomal protein L31e [Thermoproteota archaeon]|mgnify:FL=1
MSQELERVYTINLGKVLLSVDTHRAPRAINMIREFARHHMKIADIRIEEDVAHQIWSKGVRSPPRKIRVRMSKTDEGYVLVSAYSDEKESTDVSDKDAKKGKSSKDSKKGKSSKDSKKDKSSKDSKDTPVKDVIADAPVEVKDVPSKVKDTPVKEVKKDAPSKTVKKDAPSKAVAKKSK